MELVVLVAVLLVLAPPGAEALGDMSLCYVLDGILVFYGVVLTILYCRLRLTTSKATAGRSEKAEGGIYEGLAPHRNDVYETIAVEKKSFV